MFRYVLPLLLSLSVLYLVEVLANRTFEVDWANDRFNKDGQAFRFIAGSFHYFRAHPSTWQRKLQIMHAGGLNAITTYVEWALHNPKDGVYVWEGIANLKRFIELAANEELLIILRPGPYICAERDMGGLPYWLLTKYPGILLRTADINYLYEVRVWYSQLMSRIYPYLYGNGGPIIMIQVENEYGSYYACDKKYRTWLRDETLAYIKDKAVLFTNDGPSVLSCGHIDGVLATVDFGATQNLTNTWKQLRHIQPKGPLVNAEYYPGWLTHWTEAMARVPTNAITNTFIEMLDGGASVNFYMFYGGTNFGFTAGANEGGPGRYQADITSYDYDAPMNEAGDPTPKYYKLREIIAQYLPMKNIPLPNMIPKKKYGNFQLISCCSMLSPAGRTILSTGLFEAINPLTFEALNQNSGLVLYETYMPRFKRDPSILRAFGLHDRGYVYVNNHFLGILAREIPIYELPISASAGRHLQILVENQGRINYGQINDFKGLTSDVMLDKTLLTRWNMTKFPLESYADIEHFIKTESVTLNQTYYPTFSQTMLLAGPKIFHGVLNISEEMGLGDTYIDTSGWGKGVIFVNGENLGRYWPLVGPQITLYVPCEILKIGENKIVLIEYQCAPLSKQISFTDIPIFD